MRAVQKLGWLALLAAGSGWASAHANVIDNPYRVINERNAFGLKAPVAPPAIVVPTPPAPPLNIKFTGISKIAGVTRAHLMVDDPKKPGDIQYLSLADDPNKDNTRQGAVEVLAIDELKETVKIRNGANEVVLNFKDHGYNNKISAPPPGLPGQPPGVIPGPPTAGAAPGNAPLVVSRRNPPVNSANPSMTPQNPNIIVGSSAATVPAPTMDVMRSGSSPGLRSIPTRTVRTGSIPPPQPLVQPLPQSRYTAEEQVLLLEANRVRAASQGIELPPTPGVPGVSDGTAPPVPVPHAPTP